MKTLILTVALGLATAGTASADTRPWQTCGDGIQCMTLTVPADWARPNGPKTTLKMAKLPAKATKKGTLFFNLGGPGEQIAFLPYVKDRLAGLNQDYDLVTADPRGFGQVTCPKPSPQRAVYVFDNQADFEAYKAENHDFGVQCTQAAGPLAGNLNSWQVARDMDAMRAAIGESRMNYYGNSYGTMFAQAYTEFFPDRVGRMYLDSVIDHTTRSIRDWLVPRAQTDERNLRRFADWCASEPTCALHGKDVLKTFDDVVAKAPIPTAAGGSVSAARIVSRSFVGFADAWPDLAKALAAADAGDATGFTVDRGARDPDLSRIMFCADFPYPADYPDLKALENDLRRVAPRLGWRQVWPMANHCSGLPRTKTFPQHPFRAHEQALVVNGDYDATTPPADGRRVAGLLDGRYLQVPATHAVYISGTNACVRGYVDRYFASEQLPPVGTVCPEH
jgi:pimeloyl-ACP methyl ester carboxylesterase